MIGMIFCKRKKRKHTYAFIVDCDTRGNIEGETKEITIRTLNKILCDTIDKVLGDAGVINIRVEVLDNDNSM